ncbi:methylmalonyl-CoA epimerase [Chloroflexota bacterium]
MAVKINHIGIAVKNLDEAMKTYQKVLGISPDDVIRSPEMDMGVAMYSLNDVKIEVMEPTKQEGPIARFIDSRGEGVHHICFEVENIDEKIKYLLGEGVKLVDEKAHQGIEGMVAFIHPKETNSVLIELLQQKPSDKESGD